jgi:hypothetical protein
MKTIKTVSCILAGFYLAISVAGAAELESGFMGIQWVSPAAHQDGLTVGQPHFLGIPFFAVL